MKLLVAALVGALVLAVAYGWLHRSSQPVLTHEVRDLIATLQAPLEAGGANHGSPVDTGTPTGILLGLLAVAALGAAVWAIRLVRRQQRDRSSPS